MKRIKRKIKWKNVFLISFMLICIIVFINNITSIIKWKINSTKTVNQINKIQNIVNIEEIQNNDFVEIIENEETIEETNPYWDYMKMNLINVNFNELKKINSSTIGWIQINGTNINYPFVQTKDNDYYLTHSFDKTWNASGWLFLDYRNNMYTDKNIIIYGHSMKDKTMFGSLTNILKNEWIKDSNNHIIKLSTEKENSLWQIFSAYHIPTTTDYLKTTFNTTVGFLNFGNMLKERSLYNFNTTINENTRILTLSTCYNEKEKMVIHAKLLKKEIKPN